MANIIPLKDNTGAQFYPQTHEKAVVDSNGVNLQTKLASITTPTYVTAWDGASTPVVANIPAGVTVTYNTTSYTGTLAASASTANKTYLVSAGSGNYNRYVTQLNGSTYSWQNIGSTEIDLSDYATKAELNQLDQQVNGGTVAYVPTWAVDGKYLNTSGTPITLSGWAISAPIQMKKGDTIVINTQGSGFCPIASTDASGSSYTPLTTAGGGSGNRPYTYTATADMYVAVCGKVGLGDVTCTYTVASSIVDSLNTLQGGQASLNSDVEALEESVTEVAKTTFASPDFTPVSQTAGALGEFMLLTPAPFDGIVTKIKSIATYNLVEIAIYSWSDTTDISTIRLVYKTRRIYLKSETRFNIPIKKGQYIGISYNGSNVVKWDTNKTGPGFIYHPTQSNAARYDDKYITFSYEMESGQNTDIFPFIGKNIILAGDSRSSRDYDFYRLALMDKTKSIVYSLGQSGATAAQQASNSYFANFDGTEDFVIWLTGGNDSGFEVGTFDADYPGLENQQVVNETDISQDYNGTYFIQAVDHIMRKWKSLYYDWKTLDNGHKPTLIFCSDIPQKRQDASDAFSQPQNWRRKNLAIRQCCEKNGVYFLDLFNICNFDMSYEPFYVSPTDTETNNGLYYMDGVHPNAYGDDLITSAELGALKLLRRINQ